MLRSLQVRDFAIVDQIEVEFDPGMTVLTGETGAGKSILVDALGLVLGERGSAQLVRSGARRAEFSADFDVAALPDIHAWLEEQALELDEDCLIRRVINADGRSLIQEVSSACYFAWPYTYATADSRQRIGFFDQSHCIMILAFFDVRNISLHINPSRACFLTRPDTIRIVIAQDQFKSSFPCPVYFIVVGFDPHSF